MKAMYIISNASQCICLFKHSKSTKQYVCKVCGKLFDSAETLSSHQRFEDSEPEHSKPPAGVG